MTTNAITYSLVLLFTLPITARYITGDSAGFFYIVDNNNVITKIDSTGKIWFRYNDVTNGNIYSVDASNPFKTIVYFKQQQLIQTLDNNLGVINTIQLRKINLLNTTAVARASDNNIWLYDAMEMNIKKINDAGKIITASPDLFQLTGHIPQITFIKEENHKLFLCDSTSGVIVFDEYLNYERTISIAGISDFQIINQSLTNIKHNIITEINLTTKTQQTDTLSTAKPFISAYIFRKFMIAKEQNGVSLYRISE
jgi:hypothetical protein